MIDPTPDPSVSPPVAAVLVVRNNADTLEAALASITAQTYPGGVDVVIALAPSSDATGEIVERAAKNPRVTVVPITTASLTVGLNEAIAAAKAPVVIRVDPRSVLPVDYAARAVAVMTRTDAAALVGRTTPVGLTPFERAAAAGSRNRLGLAADPLNRDTREQPTEAPRVQVLRRRAFIEAGLFDEEIRHGQGWEMNTRLRQLGRAVMFTPDLHDSVRPPSHLSALTHALFAEGLWRGEFARAFPDERALRFRQPTAIVLAVLLGFILGAGGLFGIVAGALGVASVISIVLFALLVVPIAYVLVTIVLAIGVAARHDLRTGAWFVVVLPSIQFSWGFGYLAGYLNIEGAADTVIVEFE